jgi:UDPglucose--hexose-1-phosphate uridylyltransferase
MMGCSNPHPHGQVWALSAVPALPAAELARLAAYADTHTNAPPSGAPRAPDGRACMLCEYAHFEAGVAAEQGRVVVRNEHWLALVPWWAVWPFETMRACAAPDRSPVARADRAAPVLPYKRHIPSLAELTPAEKTSFADILGALTRRYDNLFACSFAYSMGVHQRPTPGAPAGDLAHLHLHFSPPLLRSASVRKFLVGCVCPARACVRAPGAC